jgi:hypothetical protein
MTTRNDDNTNGDSDCLEDWVVVSVPYAHPLYPSIQLVPRYELFPLPIPLERIRAISRLLETQWAKLRTGPTQ